MLRRGIKRQTTSKSKSSQKHKINKNEVAQKPLGLKTSKNESEELLESLVLGGEDDIVEKLTRFTSQQENTALSSQSHTDLRPAWEDEDDKHGSIPITNDRKFTGIKHGTKAKVAKREYIDQLKSQFERVSGTPNWARLPSDRDKLSDGEDSDVEDILHRTGNYITRPASLPKGILQVKQCTELNKENPLKGKVKALEFHPTAQVALTGGLNNTLSLFQVDGKTNPKIQSVFLDGFPIHCAHFSTNGEQVVMGSKHKSFQYYDMIAGKVVIVPHIKGIEEHSMMRFEVSPDGRFYVFLGKFGHMYLVSARSKELIHMFKMNGIVRSVSFTNDGRKMFAHGDEGQVYVWDLHTRDCVHRFMDEGCTQGTRVSVSPNNQYVACGSSSGVVNLYETETCLSSFEPKPLKAIMNLTSSCTSSKFNATSEILAIASNDEERAVKLIHVPSLTAYSNFPDRLDTALRIPTALDFSINSGYLTVGTHKGKALLYRLKHYGNY